MDLLSQNGREKPADFKFFASFPNLYTYKNIPYNTCDLFFYLDLPLLSKKDLHLEKDEISGVCFIKPGDLDMENIAFESIKKALKIYLETIYTD